MKISVIVVVDQNGAIGLNNGLLCHLPADLKHFKEKTTGKTIIMGRKTYESLPSGALPNRENIVLTSNSDASYGNVKCFDSLEKIFEYCKDKEEVFIIGGGGVYEQTFPYADKLYLTIINHKFSKADTYFPSVNPDEWIETDRKDFNADERNKFDFSFVELERKKV